MTTTNLETYSIVWLDANVNTVNNETNSLERRQLRSIINYLRTFDNIQECASYIGSVQQDKVVLIVSGSFAQSILSQLHDVVQLSSVYVYCLNQDAHEELRRAFSKIRGIYIDTSSLITSLTNDNINLQKMEDERPCEGIQTLVALLRVHYKGNDIKTEFVNEFERVYEADHAIWWYTKDSVFFDPLNKALRTFDIDTILAYRVFIRNVGDLLGNYNAEQQDDRIVRGDENYLYVYRGQSLSTYLLKQIEAHEGELISFANFLSTSWSRKIARFFMESNDAQLQGLEPVLYEIQIPKQGQPTKLFADISKCSHHQEEEEVLFMIGAIFRIDKVVPEDDFTVVRLTLMGRDHYELRDVLQYLTETKVSSNPFNLMTDLANLLEDMGEYAMAEAYFHRLLRDCPEGDPARAASISGLGGIALRTGNYAKAIEYEIQAVDLCKSADPLDLCKIARCYNNLGNAYGADKKYVMARKQFEHSNELKFQLYNDRQHIQMADSVDNIANCYLLEGDYDQAEENSCAALAIRIKNNVPHQHCDFIKTYTGLGDVYTKKKMFEPAYKYLMKAINIAQNVLPSNHPEIGEVYNSLGDCFASMGNLTQALEFYRKSMDIFEKSYPQDHPDRERTQLNIEEMNDRLTAKSSLY